MQRALFISGLAIVCSSASAQSGAGGFVYGKDHAYFLEAPKAWVMDSGDAAKEKVGAVFHPANAHWPESGVIIYTDFYKKPGVQTPSDAMKNDVALFQKEGSTIHPVKKPSIKTNIGGLIGEVYHFGPDQRGQYDARTYFFFKGYIDYFILTARDKATFEKSLPAFEHVVRSYAPQLKVIHEPAKKT
ncbi:MAG TPA: hypothetical protein VJU77_17785 [Chthoniobacterales bacterium]|nr:hypothetical protein [Chthoniobacterales bacterium]